MLKPMIAMGLALCLALPAAAQDADDDDDLPAGLLAGPNKRDLPEIILSVGEPLGEPWVLKSGGYYEVEITSDGSGEIALAGAAFLRAIWIDEIVIEGLEIRPLGLDSLEFDEAGTMEIGFVAIKPGSYELAVPNGGETQRLQIVIE
ncbi:hypothetical protein SAMN05421538_11526 [Paracoccus isoporae]|uniref:MSP domain-containing protein n=1 Tax=Paracoccus isoporae TaxID=591205 RepID=A0A1G7GWE4_9RHOB|nr:hypothetical protein [Paracoccus isoporae]SDE92467.1 hypothetical protein SAMN05421538_11526 [Paracoccus isoporae]